MTRTLVLALVALAGCTHFEPIERGVCGNGIVEPGEDCDSSDPSCVACAVACMDDASCPSAAYACGTDGFCHAPGGAFAPAGAPSLFLADDLRVTDVDGDGTGDVLGTSQSSLLLRYGDDQGPLGASASIVTPIQTTGAAFGDLDGDGVVDLATGTPDGVVAYTSRFHTPSPEVAVLSLAAEGEMTAVYDLFPLNEAGAGLIGSGGSSLAVALLYNRGTAIEMPSAPLCGGTIAPADFTKATFDSYRASPATDKAIDEVISMVTGSGASRRLCVTAIHLAAPDGNGVRAASFFDITPPGAAPARKPVFANLGYGSETCPSLVDTDGGGAGLVAWTGAMQPAGLDQPAHCGLATTTTALPVAPGADRDVAGVGHVPIDPPIALVAHDALVLTNGAYADVLGAFTPIYQSDRTLANVASGDLDGDGAVDAVLSADGEADLDVIYRVSVGLTPGFELSRLATTGAVSALTIEDFDGNGTQDVAYAAHLLGYDGLAVAYGFPGHSYTTLPEGALDAIDAIVPLQAPTSTDPLGVVGDMFVLAGPPAAPSISLLQGSPQRTMISYFEPRPGDDPARGALWRSIVAGNFASSAGSEPRPDLLAFLRSTTGPTSTATLRMYRLDGIADGFDATGDPIDDAHGRTVTGIGCTSTEPCVRDALLRPWATGPGHDLVLGIDDRSPPRAFELDPWSADDPLGATPEPGLIPPGLPAGAVVHAAHAVDLDGDGAPELVLAFGPPRTAAAAGDGLVEVCHVAGDGAPMMCDDLGPTIASALPGVSCVDAAPGRFRPPDAFSETSSDASSGASDANAPGLVVLCHDAAGASALVAVSAGAAGYTAAVLARDLGPLRAIQVGDVTGDRVDDVVALFGDSGARSVTVLAQCTSRDLACRGRLAP